MRLAACLDFDLNAKFGINSHRHTHGLGKVKVHLFENSTAMEVHNEIMRTFLKLANDGGYEKYAHMGEDNKMSILRELQSEED